MLHQEELKVVVSIKGGRAVIGVQQPSSDPHIETFEDHDLPALAQEVTAVTERARARWEESPKHPAYERPAPPAKRRNNQRQQGATQGGTAETQEAETQTADAEAVLGRAARAQHTGEGCRMAVSFPRRRHICWPFCVSGGLRVHVWGLFSFRGRLGEA